MLQVKDISKKYITGSMEQMALDGVSLNLRDNEFVAILGPSGSGKTTLLNIIGGLDRYDTGDLIINGVTTKAYKDRDWDSYRNHTIGFVFQSYNLIPHQTVLANVELALTIGGISREERKSRATEALIKVGLGDHINKRPNQLSGGQMQRVAIARALVNDPDILLADEPTGALDSETSVQVMDLLKEVAADRLVVMVTHNPELAEQYANRIVTLKDGKITSDSNPYEPEISETYVPVHKNLGKASMSILTAMALSFNNLWTKKARTILVSFAGSIGIIGIALILSLSNGVNKYIDETEEQTLSEYPLEIQKTSFDLTSFMGYSGNDVTEEEKAEGVEIKEVKIVSDMFATMDSNDLSTLKKYLEENESEIMKYANAVEYSYNLTPWIFLENYAGVDEDNPEPRQVCPNTINTSYGSEMQFYNMMGLNTENFRELPHDQDLFIDEYDILVGRWPEKSNEAALVLMDRHHITDNMLYTMGFRDPAELDEMMKKFSEGEVVEVSEDDPLTLRYEDFIGIKFKVVPSNRKFSYDERYKLWTDKSDDKNVIKRLVSNGKDLEIVGVMAAKDNGRAAMLAPGIRYLDSLTYELMDEAKSSSIVKEQLANRKINVMTGKEFSDESDDDIFDMGSLFSVDEEAFANAFNFNTDALNMDFGNMDLSNLDFSNMDLSSLDMSSLDFSSIDLSNLDLSNIDLSNMDLSNLDFGNMDFGNIDPSDMIDMNSLIEDLPELTMNDILSLFNGVEVDVTQEELLNVLTKILQEYQKAEGDELKKITDEIQKSITDYFSSQQLRDILQGEIQKWRDSIKLPEFNQKDLADIVDRIMAGFSDFASGYDPAGDKSLEEYLREYLDSGAVQSLIAGEVQTIADRLNEIVIPEIDVNELANKIAADYNNYAKEQNTPGAADILGSFQKFLESEDGRKLLEDSVNEIVDTKEVENKIRENAAPLIAKYMQPIGENLSKQISDNLSKQLSAISQSMTTTIANTVQQTMQSTMSAYSGAIEQAMTQAMQQMGTQMATAMMTQISNAMGSTLSSMFDGLGGDIGSSFADAFSVDQDALANAFKFNMTEKELEELMASLMTRGVTTYEGNLLNMGYADINEPSSISIFPISFESKDGIVGILEEYNREMESSGQEEKVVRYTDIVGTLMSSVTDIINSLSNVLIAFVAISLVVSSIMIGVITYISVLERRKEIGVLRAIGASKRNISNVFNAETFIIGLLAGLFGIGIARLLLIPGNYLIGILSDTGMRAVLPVKGAIVLVILSIVLTLIGGLIPSRKAAKSDPVTALRTD